MKKENLDLIDGKVSTRESVANNERKAYAAPTLHHYGSLTELVQASSNRGADGGMVTADCIRS
jgi:hypothetical protein